MARRRRNTPTYWTTRRGKSLCTRKWETIHRFMPLPKPCTSGRFWGQTDKAPAPGSHKQESGMKMKSKTKSNARILATFCFSFFLFLSLSHLPLATFARTQALNVVFAARVHRTDRNRRFSCSYTYLLCDWTMEILRFAKKYIQSIRNVSGSIRPHSTERAIWMKIAKYINTNKCICNTIYNKRRKIPRKIVAHNLARTIFIHLDRQSARISLRVCIQCWMDGLVTAGTSMTQAHYENRGQRTAYEYKCDVICTHLVARRTHSQNRLHKFTSTVRTMQEGLEHRSTAQHRARSACAKMPFCQTKGRVVNCM